MKIMTENKKQKGSVVVLAVFLVFFITALMITVEFLRLSDLEIISNQISEMQAMYCAEAGIEFWIFITRIDPGAIGSDDDSTYPADNCTYSALADATGWTYTVRTQTFMADPNYPYFYHYVYLTSTGQAGNFTRTVRAEIRRSNVTGNYVQVLRWYDL